MNEPSWRCCLPLQNRPDDLQEERLGHNEIPEEKTTLCHIWYGRLVFYVGCANQATGENVSRTGSKARYMLYTSHKTESVTPFTI
jgi:hypothetical protein